MVRWSKELMERVEGCSLEAAVVRPKVEVKRLVEEANKRNEATNIFCKKKWKTHKSGLLLGFLKGIILF